MIKKKVFVSFDYENDRDIKGSLIAQSQLENSPFEVIDMSIQEALESNWRDFARQRIRRCDCVIILCGEYTDKAKGVTAEISIAQEERKPYFLLKGRRLKQVARPLGVKSDDKVYIWTWTNLKLLLEGKR